MSGLHKHKFKWMLIYAPDHFGAYGFKRHHDGEEEVRATTLMALQENLEAFMEKGWAERKGDVVEVDLGRAGYGKLLGRGNVKIPLRVLVPRATQSAIQKVKGAGGEVITPQVEG
jgi:large subunit ribosomal protein L15